MPDWGRSEFSKLSSGCPLHCFYDDNAINRYTVALDDCVTLIERSLGVREEGTLLAVRFVIPLDGTGKTTNYSFTLWTDVTPCRYEDAIGKVVSWWEEKYPPMPVPNQANLPLYSFWYSFHQNVIAQKVEAECERAAKLGMKTVIVDDGWQTDDNSRGYAYCGDWQVSQSKIPDMAAHVKKVHDLGLKYMLWYSVPFVGIHSKAYERFKDKVLEFREGVGAYTLDPRYPDVRDYLINIYTDALKNWDLDGFKLDFIDSFKMVDTTPIYRNGMDIVVLEDAVHRLMIDIRKALTSIKPDILIEFRQSYIGPVMREFGNMFRVGDCPASGDSNRVGVIDLRLTSGSTAVNSDMLEWNENESVEHAVSQIQSSIFATVQISANLDRIPDDHIKALAFWTKFMENNIDLLQKTPIRAEMPHLLYPQVSAVKDGKGIIALYDGSRVAAIPDGINELYIINANGGSEALVRQDGSCSFDIEVFDCCGELITSQSVSLSGISSISVPNYGLITLKKK